MLVSLGQVTEQLDDMLSNRYNEYSNQLYVRGWVYNSSHIGVK